jgi:hypothetical protein
LDALLMNLLRQTLVVDRDHDRNLLGMRTAFADAAQSLGKENAVLGGSTALSEAATSMGEVKPLPGLGMLSTGRVRHWSSSSGIQKLSWLRPARHAR